MVDSTRASAPRATSLGSLTARAGWPLWYAQAKARWEVFLYPLCTVFALLGVGYLAPQIWVSDVGNARLQLFDAEGSVINVIGNKQAQSAEPSGMRSPFGCAVSTSHVFVCDGLTHRVHVFTYDGHLVSTWSEAGSWRGHWQRSKSSLLFVF